jgi:hypothetical protein
VKIVLASFWVLLGIQGLGTALFAVRLITKTDWRTSRMGRHLAPYATVLSLLYILTFLSTIPGVAKQAWFIAIMLIGHVAFAFLIWQREVILEMSLRGDEDTVQEPATEETNHEQYDRIIQPGRD